MSRQARVSKSRARRRRDAGRQDARPTPRWQRALIFDATGRGIAVVGSRERFKQVIARAVGIAAGAQRALVKRFTFCREIRRQVSRMA